MTDGNGGRFVSPRELAEVERRLVGHLDGIRGDVHSLALEVNGYQQAIRETANEAIITARQADKKAGAAHKRIDGVMKGGIAALVAWLGTAVAAIWGFLNQ